MSADSLKDELVTHLPALRSFALSLTRNRSTADDMVQDTVVKAWTNLEKFKEGTNMRAWLFTILRNNFYSSRRKLNREVADVDGAAEMTGAAIGTVKSRANRARARLAEMLDLNGDDPLEMTDSATMAVVGGGTGRTT